MRDLSIVKEIALYSKVTEENRNTLYEVTNEEVHKDKAQ